MSPNENGFALVTGASSGIGECFAQALGARKQNLVLVARSKDKMDALAAELSAAHGIRVEIFPADLSVPGATENLVQQLGERGIRVDLLINNAAFGARGEFWKLPLERQEEMLRVNIESLVKLTHQLAPQMIARKSGGIINVASTAAFQPVAYTSTYSASKAFVVSFSMALAEELRPYGIRVVTLCPGGTQTNFFKAGQYGDSTKIPGGLQPADEVVADALKSLDRGGGLVVPRLFNKLGVFMLRFAPRGTVARVAARLFRP
jgi:uncharacterized protein